MGTKIKLLLIEDNEDDSILEICMLQNGGFDVEYTRVETEEEMRNALKEKQWSCVISDYSLPRFSGLLALQIFKESGLDIPFILVSGTIGEEIAVEAMRAGAHDYIMKNKLMRLVPTLERELKETEIRRKLRASEKEKQEQDAMFRMLIEKNANIISIINEKGQLIFENSAMEKITGYTQEERKGHGIFDLLHPDDVDTVKNNFRELLNHPEEPKTITVRNQHKDGSWKWMEIVSTNLLNDPLIKAIVVNIQDVTTRKHAEEKIRQSEVSLLEAQHIAKLGNWEYSFLTHQLSLSREAYTIFEIPEDTKPEKLISLVYSTILPEDLAAHKQILAESKKNKTGYHFIYRIKAKNGGIKYLDGLGVVQLDNDDNVISFRGTMQDITDRLKIEAELRLREAELNKAQETAQMGSWSIDLASKKVAISNNFSRMVGLDPSVTKISQDFFCDLTYREDQQMLEEKIQELLETNKPITLDLRINAHNGAYIWVKRQAIVESDNGQIISIKGVDIDITEKKQKKRELLKLSKAIEQSPVSIVITDLDATIEYVNPTCERLTGYTKDELIGKNPRILNSGKQDRSFFSKMYALITKGQIWEGDLINKKKNGELYWEHMTINPLCDETGKVTNYLSIALDITQSKYDEQMIRELNENLELKIIERTAQLADANWKLLQEIEERIQIENELKELNITKDKFFSIIAHDLKNPFSVLFTSADLLMSYLKKSNNEKVSEKAQMILATSKQGYTLLQNLLEWAQTQVGTLPFDPTEVVLTELVADTLNLVGSQAESKNISISSAISPEIHLVADANLLKIIVRNLVTNAIKFTPNHGSIKLDARIAGGNIEISVADTGIGMDEATKDKLFRIDSKVTKKGTNDESGTGLGLILCKEFVGKHRGEIWVESTKGKGSTFIFTIPQVFGGAGDDGEQKNF